MSNGQELVASGEISFIPLTEKWAKLIWDFIEPEAPEMPKSWPKSKDELIKWALGTKRQQTIADRTLILRKDEKSDELNPVGIITGDLVKGSNSDNFPGANYGDVNIAYFIFAKFRGQGIAKNALTQVRIAWQESGRNPVLRIAPNNEVSQSVAIGSGFLLSDTVEVQGREFLIFKPE